MAAKKKKRKVAKPVELPESTTQNHPVGLGEPLPRHITEAMNLTEQLEELNREIVRARRDLKQHESCVAFQKEKLAMAMLNHMELSHQHEKLTALPQSL